MPPAAALGGSAELEGNTQKNVKLEAMRRLRYFLYAGACPDVRSKGVMGRVGVKWMERLRLKGNVCGIVAIRERVWAVRGGALNRNTFDTQHWGNLNHSIDIVEGLRLFGSPALFLFILVEMEIVETYLWPLNMAGGSILT
jgi:hypothetical protein